MSTVRERFRAVLFLREGKAEEGSGRLLNGVRFILPLTDRTPGDTIKSQKLREERKQNREGENRWGKDYQPL